MKILIYLYYFLRSVFLRGPLASWLLICDEFKYEKAFGIKTAAIKKSNSNEFFHYQGAGYRILFRLFKTIAPYTKKYDFVDIGCGKGRVIFVAESAGYDHLAGIELDEELIKEATNNLRQYLLKRKFSDITFIHANALTYRYKDKSTVYFLFNPFNEEILRRVLDKICQLTSSETWFIYMNPLYRKPFEEKQIEQVQNIKTGFYTEAVIYRMNAAKQD